MEGGRVEGREGGEGAREGQRERYRLYISYAYIQQTCR